MRYILAAIIVIVIALAATTPVHAQYAAWQLSRDYTFDTAAGKFGFQEYRHYPNGTLRRVVALGELGQITLSRVTLAAGAFGLVTIFAAASGARAFQLKKGRRPHRATGPQPDATEQSSI